MGRRCQICTHTEAHAINEALVVEKRSNRAIASQYSVDRNAVQRHRKHIPELLLKASRNTEEFGADAILLRIEQLEQETLEQLDALKKSKRPDRRTILATIREQRENLRLVAQVRQIIDKAPQTILVAPQAREVIIEALRPYPEARHALANRLAELEASENGG